MSTSSSFSLLRALRRGSQASDLSASDHGDSKKGHSVATSSSGGSSQIKMTPVAPAPAPSGGGMLRGLLGLSRAVKTFRQRRDDLMGTQDEEIAEDFFLKNPPQISSSSSSVSPDDDASSVTAKMGVIKTHYVYIPEPAPPDPPEQVALIKAAKEGNWTELENEMKKCKKGDRRLNKHDPETGETALMLACKHSKFLIVGRLCEMGAALNARSEDRRTALHYASAEGHEEIVKVLLRKQADPNLFGGANNQLPLHIASARPGGHISAARALLHAGLKDARLMKDGLSNLPITYAVEAGSLSLVKEMVSYLTKEQVTWRNDQSGNYLVHYTAKRRNTEIMNALVVNGNADVNVQNHDGQTPLHIAAKYGDETMVRMLQPFKANADINDKKERTPLHVAAENGHTNIVEILVGRYKANVHMRTKDGSTLMHLAADKGYADTVLAFIKRGVPLHMPNKSGSICLHAAALNGHVQVVKTLIQKGSPVDCRTKDGYTALHLAVLNSKPDIIQVLLGFGAKVDLKGGQAREAPLHIAARMPDGYQCAEMLIKSGAMVNSSSEETLETPLHVSARYGYIELLKMLLEEGADPMRLNRSGDSVLHIAVRHCHYEIAKSVIGFINTTKAGRQGTNIVNLANNEGETPFHLASELGKSQTHNPLEEIDIIQLLLDNGADPLTVTKLTNETSLHYCARSGNPDILQEIVHHLGIHFQLACNRQDKMGWSPLMTACDEGHGPVAEILLVNGARADVFDEHGKAALHLAAENGNIACCEILLNNKAFVNAKSKHGITPLHFAAQNGYTELVKLLIERYSAAANALSLDKKTPLHLAAEAGRKEVCHLLLTLHSDPNAKDALGQTPLHLAAENDHSDVVKLFMRYKPELVTATSKAGMSCAHIAANKGSVAVIKELMKFNRSLVTAARNKVNESLPLHLAVSGGHKDVVRVLIDAGSSAVAENSEGMTAIHLAAKEGNVEVLQAIPKKVSLRNVSKKNGLSPIHVAAFYGNSEIVRELQNRVDVNMKTNVPQQPNAVIDVHLRSMIMSDYGLAPLHLASYRGHESVVRLLLNNSTIKVGQLTTGLARVPLHYAAMNGHLVIVSLLMSRSASHLRIPDKKGRLPLHLASENGHVDMVSMLIGQGADINSADEDGWTALHYATRHGSLNVVKLLIETGASPTMKTVDGKIALVLSASGGHINVLNYLLRKKHNTEELLDDKKFLMDLMLCGKTNDNVSIDEFVMHSEAPLYTSAILAKSYREMAPREMERAKDLNDAGRHCENMATELLGIASTMAPPAVILRATDTKGNQFLDTLLESNMKQIVEHAAVQRYLSDIWAGKLSNYSTALLLLLFLGFLCFPPLMVYFCLPLKHHSYHHIPVIKFLAMITSHLYLIVLLTIIAAIPVDPIIYRDNFYPNWYEILCVAWIAGMIVSELTKSGASTGLGMLRYCIIFFSILASIFQIVAIVFDTQDHEDALTMMYLRNFMLSFALFSAIILIVDFFLIHHLFGPFGIIIRSVMRDLMVFIVVLMLFLFGFTFLICGLFSPLETDADVEARQKAESMRATTIHIPLDRTTTEPPMTMSNVSAPATQSCKPRDAIKRLHRPYGTYNAAVKPVYEDGRRPTFNNNSGRLIAMFEEGKITSNRDWGIFVTIFATLYFSMFAMGKPEILPKVKHGPSWSSPVFLVYYSIWMIVAVIILIPLLIAMLTETYKRIHQRSDSEWKFGRAKLIRDMIKQPAAPTPLNLVVRPFLYLRSVKRHGLYAMCSKYANFYTAEDEHEGADEQFENQESFASYYASRAAVVRHNAGGARFHAEVEHISAVLDWNIVVRRYRAVNRTGVDEAGLLSDDMAHHGDELEAQEGANEGGGTYEHEAGGSTAPNAEGETNVAKT